MAVAVPAASRPYFWHAQEAVGCPIEYGNAHVICRHALADFMAASLRVSAVARRGAAAYGDGAQRLVECRTSSRLANLRRDKRFEVRILHNFLRTSHWRKRLECLSTAIALPRIPPFLERSRTIMDVGYTT